MCAMSSTEPARGMGCWAANRSVRPVATSSARSCGSPSAFSRMPVTIAHMAVFLASDESTFVTGQDIIVDGGQISGRLWTPQQEGLKQLKQAFGLPAEG